MSSLRRPPLRLDVTTPRAPPGARIGLLGGSFDPPHAGHLAISRTALRCLSLDAIWWIVSPGNPLKHDRPPAPLARRIDLGRSLVSGESRIVVTALEAELRSVYTVDTLRYLRQRYMRTRFVWIMGADNLAGLHRWRRWREIAQTVPIAVVDRPGWRLGALASPAAHALAEARVPEREARDVPLLRPPAWVFLTSRLSDASSTELRKRLT